MTTSRDGRLVVVCVFALALSLIANLAIFAAFRQERSYLNNHPQLPIKLARIQHTIVPPSADLGLFDDDAWASMFTHRPGFVHLSDGKNYAISMFHQLHCVNRIRSIYVQLHHRNVTSHDDSHVAHCLAYLHQIIMCKADTALEEGKRTLMSDGTYTHSSVYEGSVHECNDWHHLMDFAKENYLEWKDTELAGQVTETGFVTHEHVH